MNAPLRTLLLALSLAPLAACSSAYYSTMEAFGVHKREILVDRVEEGREAQQQAKEQFVTALEAFRQIQDFDGGDLEVIYDRLNTEYQRSVDRVLEVHDRVDSIEKVSGDLLREWESELDKITTPELRAADEAMLKDASERSAKLLVAMRRAEERMDPVLKAFEEKVVYLKHHMNAQAIAALQGSLAGIESDVGKLILDMEASIAEADEFIEGMNAQG